MDTNIIEENGIVTVKFRLPKDKGRVSQSGKTVSLGNARIPLVTGNCMFTNLINRGNFTPFFFHDDGGVTLERKV